MKNALSILVTIVAVAFGLWLLTVFSNAYRAHMWGFVALWMALPFFAYYISHSAVKIDPLFARRVASVWTAPAILLSFMGFFNYAHVRNSIGERYASGYIAVKGDVEYDENGSSRPTYVYTDHWYSKVGLWFLEWGFLAACIGLPIATYKAAQRGARNALKKWKGSNPVCVECGTENPDYAKFCCKCGSVISPR